MLTDKTVLKELLADEAGQETGQKRLVIEQLSRNYIAKGIDYRVKHYKQQMFSKFLRAKTMVQAS